MVTEPDAARGWPGDVIHVNEDGWVLINRGRTADVVPGMRLLVVGSGTREMRDLFAPSAAAGGEAPLALRLRRTYELLEVVYVEDECAVAVAERAPAARRPQFYRGPSGELLVWVPLPDDYTWPPADDAPDASTADSEDLAAEAEADDEAEAEADDEADAGDADEDMDGEVAAGANGQEEDEPPGTQGQEDQRWEEALPLNNVSVGDIVVPAVPATPGGEPTRPSPSITGAAIGRTFTTSQAPAHPGWDKHYEWMGPKPESGGGQAQ